MKSYLKFQVFTQILENTNDQMSFQSKRLNDALAPSFPVEVSGHFGSILINLVNLDPILVMRMRMLYILPHM